MAGLRERIIQAQGGREQLARVRQVMACVSMSGWEFSSRLSAAPPVGVDVTVNLASATVNFADFPCTGQSAGFTPERVWIDDPDGVCLSERHHPGDVLRSVRHWLSWDQLDVVYYCGLLLWQAVSVPFLLLRDELHDEELADRTIGGKRLHRLKLHGPSAAGIPDTGLLVYAQPSGLLCRVDSASVSLSGWSRMAQLYSEHESVDGVVLASRRRVHGCLAGELAWPMLPLAWMQLEDIGLAR